MKPTSNLPVAAGEQNATPPVHPLPTLPAAEALARIGHIFSKKITAADMVEVLNTAAELDADGEALLFAQSQVLDGLFHRLITQSVGGKPIGGKYDPAYIKYELLALALRTQKQSRAALHALHHVRTAKKILGK